MTDWPPAIQPHGFLISLSEDWVIQRASTNVGAFLGRDAEALIGLAATDVLSVDAIHALRNRLALLRGPDAIERLFRCRLTGDDRHFDISVHRVGEETILEAEPSLGKHYGDITGTVRGMMDRLNQAPSLTAMLEAGIHQLRAITGFDRVAVTRFDADGSGEVVAECTRGGIRSRLGERSGPVGDARLAQYIRAPLYIISNTEAEPVAVVPAIDATGTRLDLTLSMLRASNAECMQALVADGVHAAMAIALVVGSDVWGVIECHHHFARGPGFERRAMADLFVQMFAMRIRIYELETAAQAGTPRASLIA